MKTTLQIGVLKFINSEPFIKFQNQFISICTGQSNLFDPLQDGEAFRFQITRSNRAILFNVLD